MVITANTPSPDFPCILGYTVLDALYTGTNTAVYRARHDESDQSVVIKVSREICPGFSELIHCRNQYAITQKLSIPGIVRPIALEPWKNGYALVMEDFGGMSLQQYAAPEPLSVIETLGIILQMVDILHNLSQHNVVHKDIKPANIVIKPASKQIQLIDFSIATLLPKETQQVQTSKGLEGTLAYLAPEQTGRMNRGVDYRADFYSLGVTLFELLTGELPFAATEALELIHCHMAISPPPPHEVNTDIPRMVSKIVLKLMAKNAEERYQSALGIRHDLERCLSQLKTDGGVSSFELGQRDVCDRFLIPEKLYGRDKDTQALLEAFERVSYGTPELMMVAGFSGVGKTALIKEVYKPITRRKGYFIQGKFDQFNRDVPFSAFVQAFRSLMGQLLGESDTALARWKQKILHAIGDGGQVLMAVIPEIETIIGPQPAVEALSGSAAQNQFNRVFEEFVQVFTTEDHPLVIFLDDLQWADSASLALLKLMTNQSLDQASDQALDQSISQSLSQSSTGYLLVLGAYRDNEVFAAHPLVRTLSDIKTQGTQVNTLTLAPLTQANITQLVADTLLCSADRVRPLSQLTYQKTQGNPFFTTQFLLGLYEKGCITFNVDAGHWQCDWAQAKQLALTDDVVAFMVERLKQLPLSTQEVLKLAACIGNQFDLETLTVICDRTTDLNIATDLWSTLQEGLVIPESETYKFFQGSPQTLETGESANATYRFLHDRVQQAAYSLIAEADRQKIHLKIGQRLLQQTAHTAQQDTGANLFMVVGQLNMGRDLLTTQAERQHLAQLNLQAARKAKRSTAYSTAMEYLTVAQTLLGSDSWEQDYQATLEVAVESLETAYLRTSFEEVEVLAATLLKRTQTLLDSIQVHKVRIRAWIGRGDQHKALAIGLEVLKMLGIPLLETPPSEPDDIGALTHLPTMSTPDKLMAMDIMAGIITSAWAVNPVCFRQLTFTMVDLSIKYGNCPASAFGYAWHGSLLCEALGNIEAGYAFGQLAVALLDTFNAKALRSKVLNIYATCIGCWQGPVKDCLHFHLDGLQSGLETGDLEFASYDAAEYAQYLFLIGVPLETVRAECQQKLSIIEHLKQTFHVDYLAPWLQGTLNLIGQSVATTTLNGKIYREQDRLPALVEDNQLTLVFVTYFVKSFLSFLFEEYEQALAQGEMARSHSTGVTGSLFIPTELFYSSLARMACLKEMDKPQQQGALEDVERCLIKLKNWANHAPMNFQHKCDLIAAELANHHRHFAQAIEHYDAAIAGAKKHEYFQEEAIANELAAKFYLDWGKERVAASYLQEAYYCYVRWGAKAKTDHLEQHYPQLLSTITQPPMSPLVIPASHPTFRPPLEPASNPPVFNPKETLATLATPTHSISASTRTSTTSLNADLDFASVFKASQVLSGTIQIDKLLSQLTALILQQSGGDHCALILADAEGTWQLKALATPSDTSLASEPLDNHPNLPVKLLHYVKNTQKEIVINNLKTDLPIMDAYLYRTKPKSLLCLPLRNQGQLLGILYLHNQSASGVFTHNHIHILKFLCTQAAISLENARLYEQSEAYAQQIEQSQLQTVQNEKMASLGNLVAGVAHEINNPIGFINGSIKNATAYLQDLLGHLELYQQHYPQPIEPIEDNAEDIDLDFLTKDFPKLLKSMQGANQRIKSISTSLRTFSRADTACKVSANLHEGLDSTILILKYRLKANEHRPTIQVVTDYGDLPTVDCFLGQLNQVFMNILANAIDIFDEAAEQATFQALTENPQIITVRTRLCSESSTVAIFVCDNGKGMPTDVKARIFDNLFTTKGVGKGTGLGLAIARKIVVEAHSGQLTVQSEPGKGTEFCIRLPLAAK